MAPRIDRIMDLCAGVVVCLSLFAVGCSKDKACMTEWFSDLRVCDHAYYTCLIERHPDPAGSGVCRDENIACTDDAWDNMALCAEPDGCLDHFVYCWEYTKNAYRSYDEPVCSYDLDACASWYDYSCEEECFDRAAAMHWDEGWHGERDFSDWMYGCWMDCL